MDFYSSAFQGEMQFWEFSPEPLDLFTALSDILPVPVVESPVVSHSAFSRYVKPEGKLPANCSSSRSGGNQNIHRRVTELLRRIPKVKEETGSEELSRGFRHMMRERHRREKLSQSYADLHSLLPYGSKADKNSIVQSAVGYVQELKRVKDELRRGNDELKIRISNEYNVEAPRIKFRVANPPSAIDSMISALRCLKSMGVMARGIRSGVCENELVAAMSIQTKVGPAEVERAVQCALMQSSG